MTDSPTLIGAHASWRVWLAVLVVFAVVVGLGAQVTCSRPGGNVAPVSAGVAAAVDAPAHVKTGDNDGAARVIVGPDGTVTAPAGARVRVVKTDSQPTASIEQEATGAGDDPEASLRGAPHAAGGKTDWAAMVDLAQATNDPRFTALLLIGAGCIIGAAIAVWLKQRTLGFALGAAGLGLIALGVVAETSPWLIAGGLLVGVLVLGLVWLHSSGALTTRVVAETNTKAIERFDPDGSAGLKDEVGALAAESGVLSKFKAATRRVKKRLGIATDQATTARMRGRTRKTEVAPSAPAVDRPSGSTGS